LGPVVSVLAEIRKFKHTKIEAEGTAMAILDFKSGANGIIYGTTATFCSFSPSIEIYGTRDNRLIKDSQYLICSKDFFVKQIRDFVLSIKRNKKTLVDGLENRKSLEIVLAMYKSPKLKKKIFIKQKPGFATTIDS